MTNLYLHTDGGYYCLLSADAAGKDDTTGDWVGGVIYTGVDQQMRFTSSARWHERFANVADYTGDDEQVLAMMRRCNPEDFPLEDVWAAWHDSESSINAEVIELSIAAVMAAATWIEDGVSDLEFTRTGPDQPSVSLTIGPQHLQHVLQNYTVEREAVEGGYRITVRK